MGKSVKSAHIEETRSPIEPGSKRERVFFRGLQTHTCSELGNPEKVAVLRARAEMLSQAHESHDRPHAIIGSKTQSMSDNVRLICQEWRQLNEELGV